MSGSVGNIYVNIRGNIDDLERDLDKAKRASKTGADQIADAMQRAERAATAQAQKMEQVFNRVKVAAGAAAVAIAGMAATRGLEAITRQGMEFESTMKAVQAVSRASAADYAKLEAAARSMGATTEWSAQQSGEALKYMAMAGMSTQDAIKGLPGLLDLATASQMDLATAADIATDTLTAFGMSTSELSRMNDALVNTSTRANTTVAMLGESFKYVAPVAAQMGYDVEQTSGLLGIMANAGIKASDAGTDLRQALLRTAKAAKALGMDAGSSLIEVLKEMHKRQMSANEVTELFGMVASKSAMVLMNNVDAVNTLTDALYENEGAAKSTAETMRDSAENDWKVFKSTISDIALDMWDAFGPDVRYLLEEMTEAARNMSPMFKELGEAIGTVVSGMARLVDLFDKFMNHRGVLGDWLPSMTDVLTKAAQFVKDPNYIAPYKQSDIDYIRITPPLSDDAYDADFGAWTDGLEKVRVKVNELSAAAEKANLDLSSLFLGVDGVGMTSSISEHTRAVEQFEKAFKGATMTAEELERDSLDTLYQYYSDHIDDQIAVDLWYLEEKKKLNDKHVKAAEDAAEEIAKAEKEALEERAQQHQEFLEKVRKGTSDTFMNLFSGGFDDFFDDLERKFNRLWANILADMTQPIVVPIVSSMGGMIGGSVASAMGIPMDQSGGTGGFSINNASTMYNAMFGGLESGVYNALTGSLGTSIANTVGISTASWLGTSGLSASDSAATYGVSLAEGATMAAAEGMGGGIASTIAAVAPWAAIGAIAIPMILDAFESDPVPFMRVQTTSTSKELSDPTFNYGGGGLSPAGYDYNVTFQDLGGDTQRQLFDAITGMLDQQFALIEDTLGVSVNEAILSAQSRWEKHQDGFFDIRKLEDYGDDIEQALLDLSNELFLDIRPDLTDQLGVDSGIFDADFFSSIAIEGEMAADTWLRFGQVVQNTDGFMAQFTRQTEGLGFSAEQAYQNIVTISEVIAAMDANAATLTDNTNISALDEMDNSFTGLIATLQTSGATVAQLNNAEQQRIMALGAAITGLTADSVASAMWTSIQQNQGGEFFVQSLEDQVRTGVATAAVNAFSESIYSAFIAPINDAVGAMVMSIVNGGMTTGAALTASMATIKASLDAALELMKNEDFQALINDFVSSVQGIIQPSNYVSTGNAYVPTSTATSTYTPTSYHSPSYTDANDPVEDFSEQLDDLMSAINEEIEDSGLSDYQKALADVHREIADLIAQAKEYGASEAQLSQIRTLEAQQIQEVTDEWVESAEEYVRSFANMADLVRDTQDAIDSAIANFQRFEAATEELGMTIEDLLAAAFVEVVQPIGNAFKSMFDDVKASAQTPTERAVDDIMNQYNALMEGVDYLAAQGAGIERIEQFVEGIRRFADQLKEAQLLTVYRDTLQKLGDVQARIAGMSDEWELMQISNRWGVDVMDYGSQQEALDLLSLMSYDDLLAWATEHGVAMDTVLNDMLTLAEIAERTAAAFEDLRDQLSDYRKSLVTSDYSYMDPEAKTNKAREEFMRLSELAMSEDPEIAAQAMAQLPGAAEEFLRLSKMSNTSMFGYNADFALVMASLKAAEDYAGEYVDTSDDLLDELQEGHLRDIADIISSVDDEIKTLFDDPELQAFFDEFSDVFGDDVMVSLAGNIRALQDAIDAFGDQFDENDFWDKFLEFIESGLPLSEEALAAIDSGVGISNTTAEELASALGIDTATASALAESLGISTTTATALAIALGISSDQATALNAILGMDSATSNALAIALGIDSALATQLAAILGIDAATATALSLSLGLSDIAADILSTSLGISSATGVTLSEALGISTTTTTELQDVLGISKDQATALSVILGLSAQTVTDLAASLGIDTTNLNTLAAALGIDATTATELAGSLDISTKTAAALMAALGMDATTASALAESLGVTQATIDDLAASLGIPTTVATQLAAILNISSTTAGELATALGIQANLADTLAVALGFSPATAKALGTALSISVKNWAMLNTSLGISSATGVTLSEALGISTATTTELQDVLGISKDQATALSVILGLSAQTVTDLAASLGIDTTNLNTLAAALGIDATTATELAGSLDISTKTAAALMAALGMDATTASALAESLGVTQATIDDLAASLGIPTTVATQLAAILNISSTTAGELATALGLDASSLPDVDFDNSSITSKVLFDNDSVTTAVTATVSVSDITSDAAVVQVTGDNPWITATGSTTVVGGTALDMDVSGSSPDIDITGSSPTINFGGTISATISSVSFPSTGIAVQNVSGTNLKTFIAGWNNNIIPKVTLNSAPKLHLWNNGANNMRTDFSAWLTYANGDIAYYLYKIKESWATFLSRSSEKDSPTSMLNTFETDGLLGAMPNAMTQSIVNLDMSGVISEIRSLKDSQQKNHEDVKIIMAKIKKWDRDGLPAEREEVAA